MRVGGAADCHVRVDVGNEPPAHGHDLVVVAADHRDDAVHDRGKVACAVFGALGVDVREGVPAVAHSAPAHEHADALHIVFIYAIADRHDGVRLDAQPHGRIRAALRVDELFVLVLPGIVHAPHLHEAEVVAKSRGDVLLHGARRARRPLHAHGHAGVVCDRAQQVLALVGDWAVRIAAPAFRQARPVVLASLRGRGDRRPIVGASWVRLAGRDFPVHPRPEELQHRRRRGGHAPAHRTARRKPVVDSLALAPVRERSVKLEPLHHDLVLHVLVQHGLRHACSETLSAARAAAGKESAPLRLLLRRPFLAHRLPLCGLFPVFLRLARR